MELLHVSAAEAAPVIGPRWSPIKIAPALSIGRRDKLKRHVFGGHKLDITVKPRYNGPRYSDIRTN
jgi:hypothetical protein